MKFIISQDDRLLARLHTDHTVADDVTVIESDIEPPYDTPGEIFWRNSAWEVHPLVIPPKSNTEITAALVAAVQRHLDVTARTRTYDSIDSAAKYLGGPQLTWSAEGVALRDWAFVVWVYWYKLQADIAASLRTAPTTEELIAELPEMVWPNSTEVL